MNASLTDMQAKILAFMLDHQRTWGSPPTIREMMTWHKCKSTNGIVCHLKALEAKGAVKKNQKRQCWVAVDPNESEQVHLLQMARDEIAFMIAGASQKESEIVKKIDAFLATLLIQEPPNGQPMDPDV